MSLATTPILAAPETDEAPKKRAGKGLWRSPWAWLLAGLLGATVAAPWLAPYDPIRQLADGLTASGQPLPPSAAHWLGTDDLGRDVLSRLLFGGRMSLFIAGVATLLTGFVGVAAGVVAGFSGGKVDNAVMRLTEIVMAFPGLLLAIALASVLPPGPISVVATLSLVGWTSLARIVRGNVLAIREQEYIDAAYAQGAGKWHVLLNHVWPNVRPLAMTLLALKLADMLLLEAALGFLGLGVAPPTPTWGGLVSEGKNYFYQAPWLGLPAGACIFLVVLTVNMLVEKKR